MELTSIREETEVVRERVPGPPVLQEPQPVGFGRRHEPGRRSFQLPRKQELQVLEQEQELVLVEEMRRRAAEWAQAQVAKSEPALEPAVWSAQALPWAGKRGLELLARQVLDGLRQAVGLHSQVLVALRIEVFPEVGVLRVCWPARGRWQRSVCVPIA